MRIDDTSKFPPTPLARCRFTEQIIILGKEDTP
jgi:hypothetical protein